MRTAPWVTWNAGMNKAMFFYMSLDDRYVPSVCYISGLRISGRQFFPCEGIRQGKKMFDINFTVTVIGESIN